MFKEHRLIFDSSTIESPNSIQTTPNVQQTPQLQSGIERALANADVKVKLEELKAVIQNKQTTEERMKAVEEMTARDRSESVIQLANDVINNETEQINTERKNLTEQTTLPSGPEITQQLLVLQQRSELIIATRKKVQTEHNIQLQEDQTFIGGMKTALSGLTEAALPAAITERMTKERKALTAIVGTVGLAIAIPLTLKTAKFAWDHSPLGWLFGKLTKKESSENAQSQTQQPEKSGFLKKMLGFTAVAGIGILAGLGIRKYVDLQKQLKNAREQITKGINTGKVLIDSGVEGAKKIIDSGVNGIQDAIGNSTEEKQDAINDEKEVLPAVQEVAGQAIETLENSIDVKGFLFEYKKEIGTIDQNHIEALQSIMTADNVGTMTVSEFLQSEINDVITYEIKPEQIKMFDTVKKILQSKDVSQYKNMSEFFADTILGNITAGIQQEIEGKDITEIDIQKVANSALGNGEMVNKISNKANVKQALLDAGLQEDNYKEFITFALVNNEYLDKTANENKFKDVLQYIKKEIQSEKSLNLISQFGHNKEGANDILKKQITNNLTTKDAVELFVYLQMMKSNEGNLPENIKEGSPVGVYLMQMKALQLLGKSEAGENTTKAVKVFLVNELIANANGLTVNLPPEVVAQLQSIGEKAAWISLEKLVINPVKDGLEYLTKQRSEIYSRSPVVGNAIDTSMAVGATGLTGMGLYRFKEFILEARASKMEKWLQNATKLSSTSGFNVLKPNTWLKWITFTKFRSEIPVNAAPLLDRVIETNRILSTLPKTTEYAALLKAYERMHRAQGYTKDAFVVLREKITALKSLPNQTIEVINKLTAISEGLETMEANAKTLQQVRFGTARRFIRALTGRAASNANTSVSTSIDALLTTNNTLSSVDEVTEATGSFTGSADEVVEATSDVANTADDLTEIAKTIDAVDNLDDTAKALLKSDPELAKTFASAIENLPDAAKIQYIDAINQLSKNKALTLDVINKIEAAIWKGNTDAITAMIKDTSVISDVADTATDAKLLAQIEVLKRNSSIIKLAEQSGKNVDEVIELLQKTNQLDIDTLVKIQQSTRAQRLLVGALKATDPAAEVTRVLKAANLARNFRVGLNMVGAAGDVFGLYMCIADYAENEGKINSTTNPTLQAMYATARPIIIADGAVSIVGLAIGGTAIYTSVATGTSLLTALGAAGGWVMAPVGLAVIGTRIVHGQLVESVEYHSATHADLKKLPPGQLLADIQNTSNGRLNFGQTFAEWIHWDSNDNYKPEDANNMARYERYRAYFSQIALQAVPAVSVLDLEPENIRNASPEDLQRMLKAKQIDNYSTFAQQAIAYICKETNKQYSAVSPEVLHDAQLFAEMRIENGTIGAGSNDVEWNEAKTSIYKREHEQDTNVATYMDEARTSATEPDKFSAEFGPVIIAKIQHDMAHCEQRILDDIYWESSEALIRGYVTHEMWSIIKHSHDILRSKQTIEATDIEVTIKDLKALLAKSPAQLYKEASEVSYKTYLENIGTNTNRLSVYGARDYLEMYALHAPKNAGTETNPVSLKTIHYYHNNIQKLDMEQSGAYFSNYEEYYGRPVGSNNPPFKITSHISNDAKWEFWYSPNAKPDATTPPSFTVELAYKQVEETQ